MNEKIKIIGAWIEKADHDLGSAQLIFLHIPEYRDVTAFHCQQAVEKYLKAYLLYLDIAFEKTHNLLLLLNLIAQKEEVSDALYEKVEKLQRFAVEIRYPEEIIEFTDDNIKTALAIAGELREYVLQRMNLTIKYKDITGHNQKNQPTKTKNHQNHN